MHIWVRVGPRVGSGQTLCRNRGSGRVNVSPGRVGGCQEKWPMDNSGSYAVVTLQRPSNSAIPWGFKSRTDFHTFKHLFFGLLYHIIVSLSLSFYSQPIPILSLSSWFHKQLKIHICLHFLRSFPPYRIGPTDRLASAGRPRFKSRDELSDQYRWTSYL